MHLPSDLVPCYFITGFVIDLRFAVFMSMGVCAHYSICNIMELASPCGRVNYGYADRWSRSVDLH
jgi:hypothetical protein